MDKLVAGDIGAIIKLKDVETNTTLHEKGFEVKIIPIYVSTGKSEEGAGSRQ